MIEKLSPFKEWYFFQVRNNFKDNRLASKIFCLIQKMELTKNQLYRTIL